MSVLNDYVLSQAADLLIGCSCLLAIASLAVFVSRQPVLKQRLAELGVLMTIVWLAFAIVPLPRFSLASSFSPTVAEESMDPATVAIEKPTPLVDEEDQARRAAALMSPSLSENVAGANVAAPQPRSPLSSLAPQFTDSGKGWLDLVFVVYLTTSVLLALWMFLARLRLWFSSRRCGDPAPWLRELHEAVRRQHDGRRSTLLISSRNWHPMSFGLYRPVVMLPAELCQESQSKIIQNVLHHEQAHVDRRDAIGGAILSLSLPLLWFNPMFWFLKSQAEFSRELIADDIAAAKGSKTEYVNDLLRLVREIGFRGPRVASAIGALGFRHPFTRRMAMLVQREGELRRSVGRMASLGTFAVFVVAVVALAAVIGSDSAYGQTGEPSKENSQAAAKDDDSSEATETSIKSEATPTTDEVAAESSDQSFIAAKTFRNGVVEAVDDLTIHALQEGQVVQIDVHAGKEIKKGQVLAKLNDLELNQRVKTADLDFKIAERKFAAIMSVWEKKAVTKTEVDRVKLEMEQASLALELLRDRIERQIILSPIDGVVNAIHAKRAQPVTRGDPLFHVMNLEKLRVRVYIPAAEYSTVDLVGREATIRVGRDPKNQVRRTGKVAFVSNHVDLNAQMEIWVHCDNVRGKNNWLIKPGMVASVSLGSTHFIGQDSNDATAKEPRESVAKGLTQGAGPATGEDPMVKEEVALLRELIGLHTKTLAFAQANYESGTGSATEVHAANTDLLLSKARLSVALGKHKEGGSNTPKRSRKRSRPLKRCSCSLSTASRPRTKSHACTKP